MCACLVVSVQKRVSTTRERLSSGGCLIWKRRRRHVESRQSMGPFEVTDFISQLAPTNPFHWLDTQPVAVSSSIGAVSSAVIKKTQPTQAVNAALRTSYRDGFKLEFCTLSTFEFPIASSKRCIHPPPQKNRPISSPPLSPCVLCEWGRGGEGGEGFAGEGEI